MTKSRIRMADGSEFTAFYLKPQPVKVNDKMPNKQDCLLDALLGKKMAALWKEKYSQSPAKHDWDI